MRGRILKLGPLLMAAMLAACNSTEVLDSSGASLPSGSAGPETALTAETGATATVPQQGASGQLPVQPVAFTNPVRVQLAPIVGSTVEAVTPLSRRLSVRAAQRGVSFATAGEDGMTHILKGYFSTISEGGETTVIYVWDVIDPAGNRLHRIQGREQVAGATAEGWPGVTAGTMETIADRTIDQFVEWLVSRQG